MTINDFVYSLKHNGNKLTINPVIFSYLCYNPTILNYVTMQFIPIKTRIFLPPKDDIYKLIDESFPKLQEKDIVLVTSKILAVHQGLCVPIDSVTDKDKLIIEESEKYIPRDECPNGYVLLTVKNKTLIPTSGIDESNGDGYYILWPREINKSAKEICEYLKNKHGLKDLAVIITDSHTIPLRYGVLGISIGFYGLNPLIDHIGRPDIFGREIKMSRTNVVDALSVAGVLLMGECDEKIPFLVIRDADFVEFTIEDMYEDFVIPEDEDIYYPLLKVFREKE